MTLFKPRPIQYSLTHVLLSVAAYVATASLSLFDTNEQVTHHFICELEVTFKVKRSLGFKFQVQQDVIAFTVRFNWIGQVPPAPVIDLRHFALAALDPGLDLAHDAVQFLLVDIRGD